MDLLLTQITDYLLAQSWQIAVLTIAVAVTSFLLRNRSAHVRYLLWLIVLAKCLVPPLYMIPVAVLPQGELPAYAPEPPVAESMISENSVPEAALTEFVGPTSVQSEIASSPRVTQRPAGYDTRAWLAMGWLAGVVSLSLYYLLNALRTQIWLQMRRKALPSDYRGNIESLFIAHGVRHMPRVWLLDRISQPFVWGLVRGSIYLPAELFADRHAKFHVNLLGHELSHVVRLDAMINTLQVVAQTVFWFHPFVWWANGKIRAEREKCCDEMTIARLNALPEEYSEAIVEILAAKYGQARSVPSLAVAGQVKNIEERIKTMMRPGKKFYRRPSLIAATIVLVLAMVTVPTALVLTARAKMSPTQIIISMERHNSTNTQPEIAGPLQDGAVAFTDREHKYQSIPPSLTGAQYIKVANDDKQTQKYQLDLTLSKPTILYLFLDNRLGHGAQSTSDGSQLDPDLNKAGMGWVANLGFIDTGLDILINEVGAGLGNRWMSVYAKDVSPGKITLFQQYDTTDPRVGAKNANRNMYGIAVTDARISKAEIEAASKQKEKETQSLHKAVADRNIELVRKLIAEGADVNAKNERNMTPLEWGLFRSSLTKEVAELLTEKGANLNVQDDDGWTPLHSAIYGGTDKDIVKLLVNKGTDVNLTTKKGETPLHYAVEMGDMDIVRLLVDKGADFNVKNQEGWTSLRRAALSGRKDMFGLFIAKGAD